MSWQSTDTDSFKDDATTDNDVTAFHPFGKKGSSKLITGIDEFTEIYFFEPGLVEPLRMQFTPELANTAELPHAPGYC